MAPLFSCFIATILISLFLLLLGEEVGVPWQATIATILVLYFGSRSFDVAMDGNSEIQKCTRLKDHRPPPSDHHLTFCLFRKPRLIQRPPHIVPIHLCHTGAGVELLLGRGVHPAIDVAHEGILQPAVLLAGGHLHQPRCIRGV